MKEKKVEYINSIVECSCGEKFECMSNKEHIHVEVCSKCHPFYTNQQSKKTHKGNVDKFNKKYGYIQEG